MTRKDGALENWSQPPAWWPEFEGYIHVPFQLSTGESVVLSNADGDVVDALPIHPDLEAGYSVGRLEGETEDWCIFDAPTPGEANQGTVCYTGIASAPSLTVPSGWYDGELAVGIAGATAGYTARYTTNGDLPTASSPVFPDGGLVFDATTCLSVRVWDDGNEELPSDVQDEVYIIDEFDPDIPTFSIFVNEADLWDWNTASTSWAPMRRTITPTSAPISGSRGPGSPACSFLMRRHIAAARKHGPRNPRRLVARRATALVPVGFQKRIHRQPGVAAVSR